jgi:DNA (cytosine-5)-methyltransferase 1
VIVGSLFSGIGGLDLGLARAGFRHAFFCEADPYRRRVLARHWPGVPIFRTVREVGADWREWAGLGGGRDARAPGHGGQPIGDLDLLCGGFPCQDLSVAGQRAGLAGERSGLFFEFARVAAALLPAGGWVLLENVPGLLSSHGGRDFALILATLADLGVHDLAWRVLDSRYFGVPQRRRRVYLLGRRARGRRAAEVLLEPESGGGDFAAGRAAGEDVAGSLGGGAGARGWADDLDRASFVAHALRAEGFDASEDGTGRGIPLVVGAPPDADGVRATPGAARRVDAPHGAADGPRYAACGDAVTVPVAEWIGRRLRRVGTPGAAVKGAGDA